MFVKVKKDYGVHDPRAGFFSVLSLPEFVIGMSSGFLGGWVLISRLARGRYRSMFECWFRSILSTGKSKWCRRISQGRRSCFGCDWCSFGGVGVSRFRGTRIYIVRFGKQGNWVVYYSRRPVAQVTVVLHAAVADSSVS